MASAAADEASSFSPLRLTHPHPSPLVTDLHSPTDPAASRLPDEAVGRPLPRFRVSGYDSIANSTDQVNVRGRDSGSEMMVNGAVQDVEQPRRREPEDTTNKVLLSVEEPGTKKSDTRPLETTPRSSSPAKRSASDMEGGAADTNLSSSPPPQPSQLNGSINLPTDDACSPSSPTTPLPDTRTTRSNSVDMMSGEDVLQVSGRGGHYLEMKPDTKKTMLMTVMASKTTNSADRPPAEDQITLLDDQVRIVMELSSKEFVEGQKLYIVSGSWLGRVFARTSEAQTYSSYGKEGIEGDIGPVDNTSVVADGKLVQYDELFIRPTTNKLIRNQIQITSTSKLWMAKSTYP